MKGGLKLITVIISLLVFMMSACTNITSPSDDIYKDSNNGTANQEKIELRIATMFGGGTDPSKETFELMLESFEMQNPGITIVNESATSVGGDEFRTVVKTDFTTGNEADVIFFL